jgi:hypothetical protein
MAKQILAHTVKLLWHVVCPEEGLSQKKEASAIKAKWEATAAKEDVKPAPKQAASNGVSVPPTAPPASPKRQREWQ